MLIIALLRLPCSWPFWWRCRRCSQPPAPTPNPSSCWRSSRRARSDRSTDQSTTPLAPSTTRHPSTTPRHPSTTSLSTSPSTSAGRPPDRGASSGRRLAEKFAADATERLQPDACARRELAWESCVPFRFFFLFLFLLNENTCGLENFIFL